MRSKIDTVTTRVYTRPVKYPDNLLIRLSPRQKAIYAASAAEAGVSLSEWVRAILDKAAREAL